MQERTFTLRCAAVFFLCFYEDQKFLLRFSSDAIESLQKSIVSDDKVTSELNIGNVGFEPGTAGQQFGALPVP